MSSVSRPTLRQDKATGRWVVFAPARRQQPDQFRQGEKRTEKLPEYDPDCPFCPGNEDSLGDIIFEEKGDAPQSWQVRCIPNKFPAFIPEGNTTRIRNGVYLSMHGFGRHEVVIEDPQHNRHPALLSSEAVGKVIETYQGRYRKLMQEPENMLVLIFRNQGPGAGTSLVHPHSQIIATPVVPGHIRLRNQEAERYYDTWGRCLYCDMLEFEAKDRRRVVAENAAFLAFIPYAAEVPFESWLVPKRHRADFSAITDGEKSLLAGMLKDILAILYRKLNDPDYNYVIYSAPRFETDAPHLHWYLRIRPRLTTPAGFEIGSGIRINPSLPEADTRFLREVSKDE